MPPHSASDPRHRPRLSVAGLTALITGAALIALELRTAVLFTRVGLAGRAALFLAALLLCGWGVRDLIAGWRPQAVTRKGPQRRNRFKWPVEGQVYCLIMMVLFCGSAIGRSNTLLLVFALMAGPFVMNGWITFVMLKKLSVHRTLPRRVMAGEPFSVELTLVNPKPWIAAWLMSVRDSVGNGREELHPEVLFTRVPRGGSESGRYQLRLSQRGRYTFGPLQVNSRFPLGLVERGLVLEHPADILVYPRIGRFTSTWRRQLLAATQLVSQAQPRLGTFDDEFHRIREYRPGDDPRAIHWRTSARKNELMVREYRESRDRHLIVLLDLFLPPGAAAVQRQQLEYAISLAATMCLEQLLSGRVSDLYFAANGRPFREWGGSSDSGSKEELYDLFALLQPSATADVGTLREAAVREQTPYTRTVLITCTPARAQQWDTAGNQRTGNGEVFVPGEPPQLIIADPELLASVFSLT